MPRMNKYKTKLYSLKVCWTLAKVLFLYFSYWLPGITPEEFYIRKGNYLMDLHWFHKAVPTYQKALKETKSPRVHLALGHCLLKMGQFKESVQHFRIAHEKMNQPDVVLGLAISEYETGNIDRSRELIQRLEDADRDFYTRNDAALKKLKGLLQENGEKGPA